MTERNVFKIKASRIFGLCCVAVLGLSLSGCDLMNNYTKPDRGADMQIQDYRDGLAERMPEVEEDDSATAEGAGVPELQPYISSVPENLKPMPLVSVSVNQSVPIRDVLFELAQQAEYDLELDPRIRGSIIFTAREKPFDLVIQRISEIAGLRYQFKDEILRVEMDTPYNKTYKVDYLSYIRKSTGSVRNNTGVVSGDGADTGSTFEAAAESEADFWGEVEVTLTQLLGKGAQGNALKTKKDPKITATEQNPETATAAPETTTSADGKTTEINAPPPPDVVLNVESLPVDEEEDSNNGGASGSDDENAPTFSINKQAGIINVYTNEKGHKEVDAYLKLLRRAVTAQVLIEAKILEVTLNDEFAAGIDWGYLNALGGHGRAAFVNTSGVGYLNTLIAGGNPTAGPAKPIGQIATFDDGSNFVLGLAGNDVQAFIQAVSGFGTVRALASPRLTVINNQSAVLNVATNHIFFELDVDVTTDDDGDRTTEIDSNIKNIPEGVLVSVQPSINLDNGTISMAVRPTITNIVEEVRDPAIEFVTATASPPIENVESLIPEVNVQEIDSVIQVRSGQAVVMGGLLQDKTKSNTAGVPGLGEVPMVGTLFRKQGDLVEKTELVIFLKATILEAPEDSIHNTDRDLYRMFAGDRRPLKL